MTSPRTFPGILGCMKLGPTTLVSVLRTPLLIGFVWLALAIPSYLLTLQYYAGLDGLLANNPLAKGSAGGLLVSDVARIEPGVSMVFGSLWLPCMLIMTFFAGGILTCVGIKSSRRMGLGDFLAESSQNFFRSIRSLVPMFVLMIAWTWVWSQYLQPLLTESPWVSGSESYMYAAALTANLIWLLGFASLLVLRRLAIAKMVLEQRRSALLAWSASIRLLFSRPFACFLAYTSLFTIWAVVVVVATLVLDPHFADESYIIVAVVSQLLAFSTVACTIGAQTLARRLWTLDASVRQELGEPTVTLPRAEPKRVKVEEKVAVKG